MMFRKVACQAMLFCAAIAHAETERGRVEFGIGAGAARITTNLSNLDLPDLKGNSVAYEITAGYRLPQYLSAELTYIHGNRASDTVPGTGYTIGVTPSGVQPSLVGRLPLGGSAEFYLRSGWIFWNAKYYLSDTGTGTLLDTDKGNGNAGIFGAGVSATVEGALIRLEYEQAKIYASTLRFPSLSVIWLF
ncbi:MAG: outer membrane beta-barrel protein [Steroidobacteraceae bacterium]